MAYTYGTSLIKKNNFDVLVRIHDDGTWGSGPVASTIKCDAGVLVTTLGDVCGPISGVNWSYGASNFAWFELGKGNEKPTLKNSAGQSLNLNTGDELTISENTEFSFEDLNVSADNYTELRSLAAAGNVDILLVDIPADLGTPVGYGASNVTLSAFLEIVGNDFSKVVISAKKESDISENVILPITITRTDD